MTSPTTISHHQHGPRPEDEPVPCSWQTSGPITLAGDTWCPGQNPASVSQINPPNWDWNVCHTYWSVSGGLGNVAPNVWEGELPPPGIPLANLSRPAVNCGLFYCQDPGGPYTVDPRIPTP